MSIPNSPEEQLPEFDLPSLSTRSGYSIRTLRSYLQLGVLHAGRRQGRALLFTEEHVRRLLQVDELRQRGYSLAAIRDVDTEGDLTLALQNIDQRRGDQRQSDRRTTLPATPTDPVIDEFVAALDQLPALLHPVAGYIDEQVELHWRGQSRAEDAGTDRTVAVRAAISRSVEQLLELQLALLSDGASE